MVDKAGVDPSTAPLVGYDDPGTIVAYYKGAPRSLFQFLADVSRLASLLPIEGSLINACADGYHFAVGLAAAVLLGRTTILPSTYTPETIKQLKAGLLGLYCLRDTPIDIDLPGLSFPELSSSPARGGAMSVPSIPRRQRAVTVFTSGTTGFPVGHHKTWGSLVAGAHAQAARLSLSTDPRYTLVATVPSQHMYGLESTILLGLHGGLAFYAMRPFYPQDIVRALAEIPRPRLLVTSPIHLRALLSSAVQVPALDAILCATAPLPHALAQEAERVLCAPLYEIYGATEAGQIASRRPVASPAWELLLDLRLEPTPDGFRVWGGHVEVAAPINDIIEPLGERLFTLHGRGSDIVNVAGKRSSLAFLEQQLLDIPGVCDGAFYMPDEDLTGPVARLTAFVVAPALSIADIEQALRARIDPVFLPRPLWLVDSLPRAATGKLPLATLKELLVSMTRNVNHGRG